MTHTLWQTMRLCNQLDATFITGQLVIGLPCLLSDCQLELQVEFQLTKFKADNGITWQSKDYESKCCLSTYVACGRVFVWSPVTDHDMLVPWTWCMLRIVMNPWTLMISYLSIFMMIIFEYGSSTIRSEAGNHQFIRHAAWHICPN